MSNELYDSYYHSQITCQMTWSRRDVACYNLYNPRFQSNFLLQFCKYRREILTHAKMVYFRGLRATESDFPLQNWRKILQLFRE